MSETESPPGVNITSRSPERKLAFLRIQLYSAIHDLEGGDLVEFWKLIEEISSVRRPP